VRLLAPNPEPNSVIYDPISLRVGTGKVFWPSREVNRAIRELIRLISEPRDLTVFSNPPKPSIRKTLHDCQRRRENVSAGRSKTASRMDAKRPHGEALLHDKQDEKVLPDRRAFPRRRACLTERAPADRGDFDAEPIARIEPHRRARPREPRAQVAQVPGENLNSGIFGSLPEPKTQAARRLRSRCSWFTGSISRFNLQPAPRCNAPSIGPGRIGSVFGSNRRDRRQAPEPVARPNRARRYAMPRP
jgi:hypothetical protein